MSPSSTAASGAHVVGSDAGAGAADAPVHPLLDRTTTAELRAIMARYPQARSALLPMLHLVQSVEGYVSPTGIEVCAEALGLTTAEVAAVATFYTMYKRRPIGDYHVGVCTNTLCAVLGGDAIFATLKEHLGVGNDETTADGKVTLEHIECNAACDYAPVMMVNWEFFDNQTPQSARELVDRLRAGDPPSPTRGPGPVCTWKQAGRVLAGFPDGREDQGVSAGPASTVGLRIARERGDSAPRPGAATDEAGRDGQPGTDGAATDRASSTDQASSTDRASTDKPSTDKQLSTDKPGGAVT